jgi:hypothetical protein
MASRSARASSNAWSASTDDSLVEAGSGKRRAGRAGISRSGEHGDMVPVSVEVGEAELLDGGGAAEVRFGLAEALGEDIAEAVVDHVVLVS